VWFRNRLADQYVIDTSLLTREGQVDACRAALRIVRPDVERFQCDVPWDISGSWPEEVVEAATVLAPLPDDATPKPTYRTTGWVLDFGNETWDAFVAFAPYAYSADAWTSRMKFLVDVSDEGDRLSVRIAPDQLEDFKNLVGVVDAVVPAVEWSRRRSEEWRLRINRRNADG